MFGKYEDYNPTFKPYGFIGVGIFHFDPKAQLLIPAMVQKTWYRLEPLHTEGQGFAVYPDKNLIRLHKWTSRWGWVRTRISERITISPELLYRKTFTDYIDDSLLIYICKHNLYYMFHHGHLPDTRKCSNCTPDQLDKTVGIVTPA